MSEPFAQYPYEQYVPEPPRRHRGRAFLGLAATAVVAAGVGAGAAIGLSGGGGSANATSTSAQALSPAQIADRVDPAIVDVKSTLGYQQAYSLGTGIVLTADGVILTNNHVINGATAISVTDVGNGKTYTAKVVGYDESHDIAVLKLAGASGLATATTGDSSAVKVGDSVTALGNAGGAGGTPAVASGSVTALNQSITASDESSGSSEQLSGLIETNADIQSGDSGGPLVNSHGQVIGIDTAASSSYQFGGGSSGGFGRGSGFGGLGDGGFGSQGSDGSGSSGSGSGSTGGSGSGSGSVTEGFAIPINTALSIANQIEKGQGSATVHIGTTAFLGLEIANSQQGSQGEGVLLAGTQQGTPAAKAGLGQYDLVTGLDGKSVATGTDIQNILIGHHPGDKVSITWTDQAGQSHSATVTLATGPAA